MQYKHSVGHWQTASSAYLLHNTYNLFSCTQPYACISADKKHLSQSERPTERNLNCKLDICTMYH